MSFYFSVLLCLAVSVQIHTMLCPKASHIFMNSFDSLCIEYQKPKLDWYMTKDKTFGLLIIYLLDQQ